MTGDFNRDGHKTSWSPRAEARFTCWPGMDAGNSSIRKRCHSPAR